MRTSSPLMTKSASPLSDLQLLKQGAQRTGKAKSDGAVLLPLTSLIDAFSIIVIYLLIGTQGGGLEKDLPTQIKLPVADASQIISTEIPTIRILNGKYYINDKLVSSQALGTALNEVRKSFPEQQSAELLIQADQAMDYADLDPILRAGSEAGIQKLKFAVLPKQ
jgi:biopolymer transport protein ExbD